MGRILEEFKNDFERIVNNNEKILLITEASYKNFLLDLKKDYPFSNLKIETKDELISSLFSYNEIEVIKTLLHKYNLSFGEAKKLLKIAPFLSFRENKLAEVDIKNENIKNGLTYLLEVLKEGNKLDLFCQGSYKIVLFEISNLDSSFRNFLKDVNLTYEELFFQDFEKEELRDKLNDKVFIFNNNSLQFHYLFSSLRDDLSKNKRSDQIKIFYSNDEPFYFKNFESLYKIKTNFRREHSLLEEKEVKKILEDIVKRHNLSSFLEASDGDLEDSYNSFIKSIIKAYDIDKLPSFKASFIALKEILSDEKIKDDLEFDGINVTKNKEIDLNKTYYILNFEYGTFFKEEKENSIFDDIALKKLGLTTTFEKTLINKRRDTYFLLLNDIKFASRVKLNLSQNIYDSQFIEEFKLNVIEKRFNEEGLYTKKGRELLLLSLAENDENGQKINKDFNSYDSSFKDFNLDFEKKISVTQINYFFDCPFKYYLENILKISKYEQSFTPAIGSVLHNVVEKAIKEERDVSIIFDEELESYSKTHEFSSKERLILKNSIKPRFTEIFDRTLKSRFEGYKKENLKFEEAVRFNLASHPDFLLSGRIDLKVIEEDGKVSIYDFKSGKVDKVRDKISEYNPKYSQIPLYANHYKNEKVEVLQGEYVPILSDYVEKNNIYTKGLDVDPSKGNKNNYSSDDLFMADGYVSQSLDVANKVIERIKKHEFEFRDESDEDDFNSRCKDCPYSSICYKDQGGEE